MDTQNIEEQKVVRFPASKKERRRLLRESEDARVRFVARARMICGWALLAGTFLFFLLNFRLFTPSSLRNLASYAVAGLRSGQGDAATISYAGGSYSDAVLMGNALAYADGDTLFIASPGGTGEPGQSLSFASPVLEAAGDYVLTYDRGGTTASLHNNYAALCEIPLSSPIITGSLSDDGHFTLVTDEQGARTAAAVYDMRGNEVFKWKTPEYYIVSASLSPDGKTLAALAFLQNGMTLDSQVLFYSVSSGERVAEATLSGAFGITLRWLSGSTAAALCDDGLHLISRRGEAEQALALSASDLLSFSFSDDTVALAVRSYSGAARSDIYTVRANGRVGGPFAISEEPSAIALSDAGIAVLTASGVSVYDSGFTPLWHNTDAVGARQALINDSGTVYALYAKNARLFTAHSEQSEEIPDVVSSDA